MPREMDPWKLLGASRDADLDEVQAAYRKAVAKYQPANCAGDPAEAEHQLRVLIEAYKAVSRELNPGAWSPSDSQGPTLSPQDFARQGHSRRAQPALESKGRRARGKGPSLTAARGRARPNRNETRIFLLLWILAILLGIVFGGAAAVYRAWSLGPEDLTTGDILVSVLVGELIYAALIVATIVLIVVTRQVVRFTMRLAHQGWRALPGRANGDRELPNRAPVGELPADDRGDASA